MLSDNGIGSQEPLLIEFFCDFYTCENLIIIILTLEVDELVQREGVNLIEANNFVDI